MKQSELEARGAEIMEAARVNAGLDFDVACIAAEIVPQLLRASRGELKDLAKKAAPVPGFLVGWIFGPILGVLISALDGWLDRQCDNVD
jgi:hypothetical protein